MKYRLATVVAVILLGSTLAPLGAQPAPRLAMPLKLSRLAGANLNALIGQRVIVDGFYYDGSVPLLVDNYGRVQLNVPMPPDSYKLLVGSPPAGVRSGDHVQWRVLVRRPLATDPPHTRLAAAVLDLQAPAAAAAGLARPAYLGPRLAALSPASLHLRLAPGVLTGRLGPQRYAVLIVGGWDAANNHVRYWNEMKGTYDLLKTVGYAPANLYVLYADGTALDSSVPVNYSATKANITTVLSTLAGKMGDNDTLFIMTSDHGGGFLRQASGGDAPGMYTGVVDASGNATDYVAEASYNMDINGDGNKTDNVGIDEVLCLWNHETMSDKEFATALNGITHYSKMVVQMEQCFSGGFVHDLAGPRRVIISAANWGQFSWGRQDPGTNNYSYDMFEYYFLAALRGSTPDGTATVNADTNGDGKVSILEAYQYARAHDTAAETPWYDDTGTGNEVNNPNQAPPPKRAARGTPVPPVEGNLGATYFLPL